VKARHAIVLIAGLAAAGLSTSVLAAGAPPAVVTLDTGAGSALPPAELKAMVLRKGGAVFSGLDKVTARVTTIYAPIDIPVRFGSLQLTARACDRRPPEEQPEQSVFVEVDDMEAAGQPKRIFTGWMFWSSPALNAVEHPVYDFWLNDCMTNTPAASAGSP
jgi:hypothetical protein